MGGGGGGSRPEDGTIYIYVIWDMGCHRAFKCLHGLRTASACNSSSRRQRRRGIPSGTSDAAIARPCWLKALYNINIYIYIFKLYI